MNELKSIENMSFEEALAELESIVKRIDSGLESLDSSINSFERAVLLKNHCEKRIKDAKLKIDKIVTKEDGAIGIEEIPPNYTK